MILINDQPILQSLVMEIWLVLLMCPPIDLYIPLILLLIFSSHTPSYDVPCHYVMS
jgi:hypothetical protein